MKHKYKTQGAGSIDQEREPLNKFSSPFHGSGWSHSQPLISAFPLIVDKREKPSMDGCFISSGKIYEIYVLFIYIYVQNNEKGD